MVTGAEQYCVNNYACVGDGNYLTLALWKKG